MRTTHWKMRLLGRIGAFLVASATVSCAFFVEQPVGSTALPAGALREFVSRLVEKEARIVRKLFATSDLGTNESLTWESVVDPGVLGRHLSTTQSFSSAEIIGSELANLPNNTIYVEKNKKDELSTTFGSWTSAVAASVVLTIFTEFGDRTFFISGLLALKYPKVLVFTASSAALVVQTVFSTAVGHVCHLLPISGTLKAFPIDDYLAAILLLTFGCLHAKAAICGETDEPEIESKATFRDEEGLNPYVEIRDKEALTPSTNADDDQRKSRLPHVDELTHPICTDANSKRHSLKRHSVNAEFLEASRDVASLTREMEDATNFRVWRKIFWIIFIAELGDKSMFSTVALAAAQNPIGVFFGCSVAHCLVTLVAVIAGYMLQDYVSEWAANVAGAILFFMFAAVAFLEGLARQGFKLPGPAHTSAAATTGAAFLVTKLRSAKLKAI